MTTNFDRAASFYDNTRGLPEATMTEFTDRLAEGLGRAEEVLEIGVGTGRVAVPLSARGYAMTGIDVSKKMLNLLKAKSSVVKFKVADATSLPFNDKRFDAILAVDVFHVISEWRLALEESVRVLRIGGRIVLSTFAVLDNPTSKIRKRIFELIGPRPKQIGIDISDIMTELENHYGATTTELSTVPHIMTTTLASELNDLRIGIWSRYWSFSENLRHQVADRVEIEFRDAGKDLDEPLEIKYDLQIMVATLSTSQGI